MKLSEIIIEKLLEQRAVYLNMLKHLDFELAIGEGSDIKKIEKQKIITVEQIKKNRARNCISLFKKSKIGTEFIKPTTLLDL